MASKAFLLASLASLAVGLLPPCLPELGSEFCPATVPEDNYETIHESVVYPSNINSDGLVANVLSRLGSSRFESELRRLTGSQFPNRHCRSKFGLRAVKHIEETIKGFDRPDLGVEPPNGYLNVTFTTLTNETPQGSLVVEVSASRHDDDEVYEDDDDRDVIVIGAHLDSINHNDEVDHPDDMIAPGANDNGSGSVVLLEVLRALLVVFAEDPPTNNIQFHWYGAEEIGLLGSDSVFREFRKNNATKVKAMLNLDMVGYSGGHEAGSPKIAVLTDQFVDKKLTGFVRRLITKYTDATPVDVHCGYACSDHASAHKYGFPSAMIGESSYMNAMGGVVNSYPHIHTANDTIDQIDFSYMMEFARLTAAFISEMAFTDFSDIQ